jgi:hypothetical protein
MPIKMKNTGRGMSDVIYDPAIYKREIIGTCMTAALKDLTIIIQDYPQFLVTR